MYNILAVIPTNQVAFQVFFQIAVIFPQYVLHVSLYLLPFSLIFNVCELKIEKPLQVGILKYKDKSFTPVSISSCQVVL
jgi:hypothetical protein